MYKLKGKRMNEDLSTDPKAGKNSFLMVSDYFKGNE
jgi:hypothetical protein